MSEAQVMIHVRFSPDGNVTEIGERPGDVTPQAWFNRLSQRAASGYQVLSGGRGVYRLARSELNAVKSSFTQGGQT